MAGWLAGVAAGAWLCAAASAIGAAVAWSDLKDAGLDSNWSWRMFWLVLGGASLAQVATNASNDYFDHTSNADEINKVPSPFNGGSRVREGIDLTVGWPGSEADSSR